MKNYTHFFFDMDNTVTRSRCSIAPEMQEMLVGLMGSGKDVIIVSGARVEQSRVQTRNTPCYYLGQNGNHAFDGNTGKNIWRRELTPAQRDEVMIHIRSISRAWFVRDEGDLIDDRGSQISYSLLGHHEDISKKEAFDADFSKRRKILEEQPLHSETIEVRIGGTTCLDYIQKGKHKGFNVAELIALLDWDVRDSVYVGDALFPGGNDETVIGVIDTQQVENPDGTIAFLQRCRFWQS